MVTDFSEHIDLILKFNINLKIYDHKAKKNQFYV